MADIIKLAVVLTLVSVVAGFAIAMTNRQTRDQIEMRKKEAETAALQRVLPAGSTIEERTGSGTLPPRYWVALKENAVCGYAFRDSSRGYAKDIRIMVGVATDGSILGMAVLSQAETPGLGTRVEETLSTQYLWNGLFTKKEKVEPWFTRQFNGLVVLNRIGIVKTREWHLLSDREKEDLRAQNAVTAITGATISTNAVIRSVSRNIPRYIEQCTSGETPQ